MSQRKAIFDNFQDNNLFFFGDSIEIFYVKPIIVTRIVTVKVYLILDHHELDFTNFHV